VRAILIVGKPEIFTAGNDLEDFMKNSPRRRRSKTVRSTSSCWR
jgi:enoyl-CoA hydratase/carnithine racemase